MATRPQLVSRAEQPYASITNAVPMGASAERSTPSLRSVRSSAGWRHAASTCRPTVLEVQPDRMLRASLRWRWECQQRTRSPATTAFNRTCSRRQLRSRRHVGHPQKLRDATSELLDWAAAEGTCMGHVGRTMVNSGRHAWRSICTIRSASPTWRSGRRI